MRLPGFLNISKSIHKKLFFLFIVTTMLPSLLIAVSTYFISLDILKEKAGSIFSQSVINIGIAVENELMQIRKISDFLYINRDVKDAVLTEGKTEYEIVKYTEKVEALLKNYSIANIFQNINTVQIIGFSGLEIIFSSNDTMPEYDQQKIRNSKYFIKAMEGDGQIVFAGTGEQFSSNSSGSGSETISLFRVIRDSTYSRNIGVMYIDLKTDIFTRIVGRLDADSRISIFIVDNHNSIINESNDFFSADMEYLLDENAAGIIRDDNMMFRYDISEFGWKVIGLIPIKKLSEDYGAILLASVLSFIIGFSVACVLWYLISSGIVRPVKDLTDKMKKVTEGNFNVKVNYRSNDEIGILSSSFNFMLERINQLFREGLEKQNRIRDAEYKALQSQINPHFIFNTLNSIRWMAIISKADNIKRVIDTLARLLKNSTNKMSKYIAIREELENLEDFIYIQKLAYKNKFEVIMNVDEQLLDLSCIKFILQPVLENAIFHGIEPKKFFGKITVTGRVKDGAVVFSVADDGVGMSREQISVILNGEQKDPKGFSGIGIANVNERLKLEFGEEYGIEIKSRVGEGTEVLIKFPVTGSEKNKALEV